MIFYIFLLLLIDFYFIMYICGLLKLIYICLEERTLLNRKSFYNNRRSIMSDTIKNEHKNNNKTYNPNNWVISNDNNIRIADMRKSFKELGVFQPAKNSRFY